MKFLVLHGVNLNMFGKRDSRQYGTCTLADINDALDQLARSLGVEVKNFQSNDESRMIEAIHDARDKNFSGLLINAGAWTHYSYALADALAILTIPIVEVHMSNIFAREAFRRESVISPLARGIISGFGLDSYLLALRAAVNLAKRES